MKRYRFTKTYQLAIKEELCEVIEYVICFDTDPLVEQNYGRVNHRYCLTLGVVEIKSERIFCLTLDEVGDFLEPQFCMAELVYLAD